ncbi:HigA family addiction module antitoxin [Gramella jeungdoensis]|uniref:HigA family addiction module antitoxin n=1 Tax=Gramella jeungdoensis TaxID=708091 RepID=A0ABT0Z1E6_9FLAO|nr:HigA family addiction module antitoxin [Gramella jeungdoensis]MCM8569542.1 HigA family addiction module antitoxin [Gramella jeungdoensis]
MATANNITPYLATHPGEIIKDELDANSITQADFSKLSGIKRSQLNEIIKGKRNINAELAILLEKILGVDAEYWMEAQKNYELDLARIKAKESKRLEAIEKFNFIKDKIAYKFLKKEKVISGDPIEDIEKIQNIYEIEHFEELATLGVQPAYTRFRKSPKLKIDPINIIGWTKLVQYQASKIHVGEFNYEKSDDLIRHLRLIINENNNTLEKVQNCLKEFGIKLIYQPKGEKTPVDGVSFWSEGNPAIGMSLRHKRIDNFAFTLFHELGHVFKHLLNNNEAQFIDLDPKQESKEYKNSIEEKEANKFAEENLITQKEWEQYLELYESNPFLDENIISFAEKINIHPYILRGRICHKLESYKHKTSISKKIN